LTKAFTLATMSFCPFTSKKVLGLYFSVQIAVSIRRKVFSLSLISFCCYDLLSVIKAFIFDFDGIIVDSEKDRFRNLNNILAKFGYDPLIDFKTFTGKKTRKILLENYSDMPRDDIEEIYSHLGNNLKNTVCKPIAGIVELLNYLSKQSIEIALTTGTKKKIVLKHLDLYKIKDKFQYIVSGEMYDKSKADPEAYLVTLKIMSLKASETIVIEDSQAGIDSAKTAGCNVYAVDTYDLGLKNADKYFKNHKEILKSLK